MRAVFLFLLFAVLAGFAQARGVRFNGVKPDVIIDVRTPEEFAAGHIEDALNIPLDQIGSGIQSVKGLKKTSVILVYCRSGRRSALAKTALEQQGYQRVLDGGGMDSLSQNLKQCTSAAC